jgi:hypothetical protein
LREIPCPKLKTARFEQGVAVSIVRLVSIDVTAQVPSLIQLALVALEYLHLLTGLRPSVVAGESTVPDTMHVEAVSGAAPHRISLHWLLQEDQR